MNNPTPLQNSVGAKIKGTSDCEPFKRAPVHQKGNGRYLFPKCSRVKIYVITSINGRILITKVRVKKMANQNSNNTQSNNTNTNRNNPGSGGSNNPGGGRTGGSSNTGNTGSNNK